MDRVATAVIGATMAMIDGRPYEPETEDDQEEGR